MLIQLRVGHVELMTDHWHFVSAQLRLTAARLRNSHVVIIDRIIMDNIKAVLQLDGCTHLRHTTTGDGIDTVFSS